jgi:hypothetical protein
MILLILASHVARITSVNHQHPAQANFVLANYIFKAYSLKYMKENNLCILISFMNAILYIYVFSDNFLFDLAKL